MSPVASELTVAWPLSAMEGRPLGVQAHWDCPMCLFYLEAKEAKLSDYHRYRIETEQAPNLADHPSRFRVQMNRPRLAAFLLQELIHFRGNMPVVLSRPCVYGVFSGPIGGFAPREQQCVGCLRCTVQYPDMVQIVPNPDRLSLGDSYLTPNQVDTLLYEASTGRVPVKGAGYRGAFGGDGWDGMWTDMSEIVRPTRDGIHGREYISTSVDLGWRPQFLEFDASGRMKTQPPQTHSLPVPIIFDLPPLAARQAAYINGLAAAAAALDSALVLPLDLVLDHGLAGGHIVPLVRADQWEQLPQLDWRPAMIELEAATAETFHEVAQRFPESLIILRLAFGAADLPALAEAGVGCFHVTADYHGRTGQGFVMEAIRGAHEALVEAGLREQVSLIGSGGIVAAEHAPKAIICGLDAVAIETAALIAVQASFEGEVSDGLQAQLAMPRLDPGWVEQRLINLVASWRDQMLEILGAMGLREVRRLRGEVGRSMRQQELEREAFAGIEGYSHE
jgi:hypothetical protein